MICNDFNKCNENAKSLSAYYKLNNNAKPYI